MKSIRNIIDECIKMGGYTINDILAAIVQQGYSSEEAIEGINIFVKENISPPDILF